MGTNTYKDLDSSVLNQAEAVFVLMDLESRFLRSNQKTANLFGFFSEELMLGKTAFDINCPAVAYAEYFMQQDKDVREAGRAFEYLDVHTYHRDQVKVLFTRKTPFYQDGILSGTLCHCTEINDESVINQVSELVQSDQSLFKLPHDRSYVLGDSAEKQGLSELEMRCVFYFLRGFSVGEVAKKLVMPVGEVEACLDVIRRRFKLEAVADLVEYSRVSGLVNVVPKNIVVRDV
jgi:hypothetical protein